METLVEPLAVAASHVPFSEKERDWMGPDSSKFAGFAPDVTSKTLIWPSTPPAAKR